MPTTYLEMAQQAARRAQARAEMNQPVLPLADPNAEARRQRLFVRLTAHPSQYVIETEQLPDGSQVIALGIPGATCELLVPPPRDPFEFAAELFAIVECLNAREISEQSEIKGRT